MVAKQPSYLFSKLMSPSGVKSASAVSIIVKSLRKIPK